MRYEIRDKDLIVILLRCGHHRNVYRSYTISGALTGEMARLQQERSEVR